MVHAPLLIASDHSCTDVGKDGNLSVPTCQIQGGGKLCLDQKSLESPKNGKTQRNQKQSQQVPVLCFNFGGGVIVNIVFTHCTFNNKMHAF